MGEFANVPDDKYELLGPEDKAKVDAWRNQGNDVERQARDGGNYGDVVTREENKVAEKPASRKAASK